jgi:hypothetical protein
MPLGRSKPTVKTRAMTASASRLKVDKRVTTGRAVRKPADWQERAYGYYDDVPEVGDGVNFFANSCSRIRFYAAVLDEEGNPRPVDVDEDGQQLFDACNATMALIGEGPAQAAVTRPLAVNLELAGEAYLQGVVDPDTAEESIRVRSVSEVDDVDGRIAVRDAPGGTPKALDPKLSPTFDRVWRPHPRFQSLPDSPMVRLLGVCEELLLLSQAERAGDRQRLARSGLLLFSSRVQLPATDPEDQRGTADRLMDLIYNAATNAISEEGSASAALPVMAECDPADGQKVADMVFHQTFDRPADATTLERRDRLIRRVGHGLDLPPDVLTGMQNVKYSNAIQIDKNVFRHYVEPFAVVMADALSVSILRPGLLADQIDPATVRQVFVWYDPTELVSEPDQAEPAQKVYDAGELSGTAMRRLHGISEDDAPTAVERALRLAEKFRLAPEAQQQIVAMVATGQLAPDAEISALPLPAPAPKPPAPASSSSEPVTIDGQPITAAAVVDGQITTRPLVDLDREVRTRLHTECELAVTGALRRAGMLVQRSAQSDPASKAIAASTSYETLPATLGPAVCAELVARRQVQQQTNPTPAVLASLVGEELFRGALDDLRVRAAAILGQAQTRAVAVAARLAGGDAVRPGPSLLEGWRTAAVDYLTGSLGVLLSARLFAPAPSDEPVRVPMAVARAAVAYASGLPEGHGGYDTGGLPVTVGDGGVGLATGRITADVFDSAALPLVEYEWNYGVTASDKQFEPHYALNGLRFTSFTDETLTTPGSFPDDPFLAPGDHDGCACDVIPIYDAKGGMAGTGDEPNLGADEPVYAEPIAAGVR